MKNLILTFIIIFVSANLFAQTRMVIYENDNTIVTVAISEIDNVYFEILPNCGIVTDIDGNEYKTITIGTQCWIAENLKVTHYPNGDTIPHITDSTAWRNLDDNNTDDAYCFYKNLYAAVNGPLYTYAAAIADNWTKDNADGQGVCPDGWHLPTNEEWATLNTFLDTVNSGSKLAAKKVAWMYGDLKQDMEFGTSGFRALPGGYRNYSGTFSLLGKNGFWWSATEKDTVISWRRSINYKKTQLLRNYNVKSYGFSVRCIKN